MIIFVILIILLLIYILFLNSKETFVSKYNFKNLIINHYKFKSDEEYKMRTAEYNKNNSYMKDKLSNKINDKWMKRTNKKYNNGILIYLEKLKNHINTPLKKVKKYNDDKKYKYFISIVTMFRFEDDYLEEWLHYNIMNGVDHFYLIVIIIHKKLKIY